MMQTIRFQDVRPNDRINCMGLEDLIVLDVKFVEHGARHEVLIYVDDNQVIRGSVNLMLERHASPCE